MLVVDDDAASNDAVQALLDSLRRRRAYPPSRIGDALAIMEDWAPDVVVSDISMPGEDSYALLRRLREKARAHLTSLPSRSRRTPGPPIASGCCPRASRHTRKPHPEPRAPERNHGSRAEHGTGSCRSSRAVSPALTE